MLQMLKAVMQNDQGSIQKFSAILAAAIKGKVGTDIPQENIARFEENIQNGIYEIVFSIVNFHHHQECQYTFGKAVRLIQDHWGTPVLSAALIQAQKEMNKFSITFTSQFLNEQFEIGNIYLLSGTPYLKVKAPFQFKGVANGMGKEHLNKINLGLLDEAYYFDYCLTAYTRFKH